MHETLRLHIDTVPIRVGPELSREAFFEIRRRLVLDGCKWDPQLGDTSTLATFPLVLTRASWHELRRLTEQLAGELSAAEREIFARPSLHETLAVPRAIRRLFNGREPTQGARVVRFDFHWTTDGWRISEVNSDVPGGYLEASAFSRLVAAETPRANSIGDPSRRWVDAITSEAHGCPVALLCAPGYLEDYQVVAHLARELGLRNVSAHIVGPHQVEWSHGRAHLKGRVQPLGAIVRFYQAEWLPSFWRRDWEHFFVGGRTPVLSPGIAVLTETKRFPLVLPLLSEKLPTWRALLPETRDPRDAPWEKDHLWILKRAYCNTGDSVILRERLAQKAWNKTTREVVKAPSEWVAQRRFEPVAFETPHGHGFPCLGVYALEGEVIGVYGRIAATPVVDWAACDVAVLVDDEE